MISIEKCGSADDWAAIRRLCCLTANNGAPISEERWPFFGELWIGPYQKLRPELTYLARRDGMVVGYLTGSADTAAFEREKFLRVTVPLLVRVGLRRFVPNADTRRFVRRTLGFERGPNERFARDVRAMVDERFSAHLHVNVDASCRGQGVGRQLMTHFFNDLRVLGVAGVHVYCGADPVSFYRREGFQELAQISFKSKAMTNPVPVFLLGRAI